MYIQKTYMKQYYLDHKEKIKERAKQWRRNNPEKLRLIKHSYERRPEIEKVLPFEERVSKRLLKKMKVNTGINRRLIKRFDYPKYFIPRKRILEGG